MNLEISRYKDLALHNHRLIISGISLTLVTNVGRTDDRRPYLSSPQIEVRPFGNGPCHLNINARLHYNLTIEHLITLNGFVGDFSHPFHRIPPLFLF